MFNKENAEENIKQFIEKHGQKGFLELILSNYLFELIMFYLHTDKSDRAKQDEAASYRFYVNNEEKTFTFEQIDDFKEELKEECNRKAKEMSLLIIEKNTLQKIDESLLLNDEIINMMEESMNEILINV